MGRISGKIGLNVEKSIFSGLTREIFPVFSLTHLSTPLNIFSDQSRPPPPLLCQRAPRKFENLHFEIILNSSLIFCHLSSLFWAKYLILLYPLSGRYRGWISQNFVYKLMAIQSYGGKPLQWLG